MPTSYIRRGAALRSGQTGLAAASPIYMDSDTNEIKYVPAASGSTEKTLVDLANAQTLTNKTLTSPIITGGSQTRQVQIYLTEATATLLASEGGKVVIATKASATQTFTLPIATTAGLEFIFIAGSAGGELLVTPNAADTMLIKATEDAGASILTAAGAGIKNTAATNVIGDHIHLVSDGVSQWYMIGQSGIWAAQ